MLTSFCSTLHQKNSRRLELSISKNTLHGRWGQGPGSVNPKFPSGLPFPVSEILEVVAFRDSGNIFQHFPGTFPEFFLGPRTDPGNSHGLLEFSEVRMPSDQGRKTSPKRKFSGRISRGHPGVTRAGVQVKNFWAGPRNPLTSKHLDTDVHDPNAWTSMTPKGCKINSGRKTSG